jgi:hypothetical protein
VTIETALSIIGASVRCGDIPRNGEAITFRTMVRDALFRVCGAVCRQEGLSHSDLAEFISDEYGKRMIVLDRVGLLLSEFDQNALTPAGSVACSAIRDLGVVRAPAIVRGEAMDALCDDAHRNAGMGYKRHSSHRGSAEQADSHAVLVDDLAVSPQIEKAVHDSSNSYIEDAVAA